MPSLKIQNLKTAFVALLALSLIACASSGGSHSSLGQNPKDPFEGFNRAMYSFNSGVDTVLTKPLAKAYDAITPEPVQNCISNVFDNLRTPISALNNLLQGKVQDACSETARFLINTTVGLAGCFDVAKMAGLERKSEDFGQTLGKWGVPSGSYLVLPLLGPSNVRDALSLVSPTDKRLVIRGVDHIPTRNSALGLELVDTRTKLLGASAALEKMDVDQYSFVRDASIARRRNQVYDGDPPDEDEK